MLPEAVRPYRGNVTTTTAAATPVTSTPVRAGWQPTELVAAESSVDSDADVPDRLLAELVAWARTTPHHNRLRQRGPTTGQMPVSSIHAAEFGADHTVCGLTVSTLEGFGTWGGGGSDACPACKTVADARSAS